MRIGELARAAGVMIATARLYERSGIFRPRVPARTGAEYGPEAVERLRFAIQMRACGVDMKTVAAAMQALDAPASQRTELLAPVFAQIDAQVMQLQRLHDLLTTLARQTATRPSTAADSAGEP
jgi:DNA-binding transcriptional MerR regulator